LLLRSLEKPLMTNLPPGLRLVTREEQHLECHVRLGVLLVPVILGQRQKLNTEPGWSNFRRTKGSRPCVLKNILAPLKPSEGCTILQKWVEVALLKVQPQAGKWLKQRLRLDS
jgi:hypothetical protein